MELTQIAPVPDWLVANRDALSGKVSRIPTRDEMQPMVNEQLIVELYSLGLPRRKQLERLAITAALKKMSQLRIDCWRQWRSISSIFSRLL